MRKPTRFAGSVSCAACHKSISESHAHTAHFRDSELATAASISGSFAKGSNTFTYNKWMEVRLERKGDRFFQAAMVNNMELETEPFDIVIGSGRKGQTYLYWKDNDLFQLPVSYYTPLDKWCNSPGYPINYIRFDRAVPAQCLECHSTFARLDSSAGRLNTYDRGSILLGIACEKCHGPAAKHIAFHQENPGEKTGRFILVTTNMDRQARVDACALCHSGFRTAIRPPFSFRPGDRLDDFSQARYNADGVATLDVHGNQYGLLTASKCYRSSPTMDCSTCHNPHVNEFAQKEVFSTRCMTCHAPATSHACSFKPPAGLQLERNCIDCHMPLLPSKAIQLNVEKQDTVVPDLVRTHHIAVYPEQVRAFLDTVPIHR